MDFEDARAAIYGRLDTYMTASYAGTKVQYRNRNTVDLAKQTAPFVSLEIVWNDGEQVEMGPNPRGRMRGAAWLGVWVKEGQGVKVGGQIMSALTRLFKTVSFGGVTAMMPVPLPPADQKGWEAQRLRVPLYFDFV